MQNTIETPVAETTVVQEIPEQAELAVVVRQNSLLPETAQSLQQSFGGLFSEARSVLEKSRGIVVKSAEQKLEIKLARECRLALKAIRVAGDKTRKTLKEESLKKGKAIDGFYNILEHLVSTEETRLEEQEKFVERQEAARKAALKSEREIVLRDLEADPALYQLAEMTDETFTQLVDGIKLARAAAAEKRRKEEADRIAREKAEAEERERVRQENERLKREAEEREAQLKAEREKAERERREAEAKAAAERKALEEKARVEREAIERKAAEERARIEAERKAEREAAEKIAAEREAKERAERQAAEAKMKAEREAAIAKEKAERADAERRAAEILKVEQAKAKAEREAREKLEREAAERRAKEEAIKRAEEEAKRKASAAPDREKLETLAVQILALNVPELSTDAGKALSPQIRQQVEKFAAWVRGKAGAL
jgi:hypothetical protein